MKTRARPKALPLLRGPRGFRGSDGLSAYGVWLRQGNIGTEADFFRTIAQKPPFAYLHRGARCFELSDRIAVIAPLTAVLLHPGLYRVEYTGKQCRLAWEKEPSDSAVYFSQNENDGCCVFYLSSAQAPTKLSLLTARETVDAAMLIVRITGENSRSPRA